MKASILYHNEEQKSTGFTDRIGNKNCGGRSGAEIDRNLRGAELHKAVWEVRPEMEKGQSRNFLLAFAFKVIPLNADWISAICDWELNFFGDIVAICRYMCYNL